MSIIEDAEDFLKNYVRKDYKSQQLIEDLVKELKARDAVIEAAKDLYDNRLGWSDGRSPYAHPEFWNNLNDELSKLGGENGS